MASDGNRKFPDSGTSGELLQLLPLKRPKKTVNWNKCLICQSTNSKETLRQASADGITTFKEACSRRRNDVFERLSSDIEHMSTMQVLWHGKCYQSYTSKRNLLFVKSTSSTSTQGLHTMVDCEGDTDVSASRSSRSRVVPVDWSFCLFCQKKKHKSCRELL